MFHFAGNSVARLYACLYAALSLFASIGVTSGQTIIDWDNPAGGSYNSAVNWNPANVPNTATETARFNLDEEMTISFAANSNTTIDDLLIPQGDLLFRNAGSFNDATLNISHHAHLTGGALTLTRLAGASADVNLIVADNLAVRGGSELNILNSALVQARSLALGDSAATGGTILVDGAGSMLVITTSSAIIGSNGGTATLTFQNDSIGNSIAGTTNFAVSGIANTVGYLNVLSGATLQTESINLGTGTGTNQTAIVTVTNLDSALTQTGASSLTIGNLANDDTVAQLDLPAGGTFTSGTGAISIRNTGEINIGVGATFNANGNVTIDGGSIDEAFGGTFSLAAGRTLTVKGGGSFTQAGAGFILPSGSTATVTGEGSTWTNANDLFIGTAGPGTLNVLDNGLVEAANIFIDPTNGTLNWDIGGTIRVNGGTITGLTDGSNNVALGSAGIQFFELVGGATLSNNEGRIGGAFGTAASVTIRDADSSWTNSGLFRVGDAGFGIMTIEDGGHVSNTTGAVGFAANSFGTATVTGTDSGGNPSTWANTGSLCVGCGGEGTLDITAGGNVTSTQATIGDQAGVEGVVTISGTDGNENHSLWTNHQAIVVAQWGTGTLTIEAGAQLVSPTPSAISSIAAGAGSAGVVTVTGINSSWTHAGHLEIGGAGVGTMSVTDGAHVSFDIAVVGSQSTSEGTVVVSGLGSTWTNSGSFHVGNIGEGTLLIEDGGSVANTFGVVAGNPISAGSVTVRGVGSKWTNSGSLYVGGSQNVAGGQGTLSVNSGATVEVGDTLTIYQNGTVNLLGGTIVADDLAMLDGVLNFPAGTLQLGSDQTIAIDSDLGTALGHNASLIGGQQLIVEGTLTFAAPLTLDGGTLAVHNIANGSLLGLQRGTLHITQAALTIGPGGQFGDDLQLKPDVTIEVDQGTTNSGLIYGNGILGGPLNNTAAGEIRAEAGSTLTFTGASADNSGALRMIGGLADFHGPLTNTATGRITGRGTLIARAGLANQGHVAISAGITDVYGDVANDTGNASVGITVSGNADVNFWDDVTNTSGLFRVSANSSATFFGAFGGGGISGTGDVYFEADITPGSSPATVTFGGNMILGSTATLLMELGGTILGSQYDHVDVTGQLVVDGTLQVELIDGFMPAAGDSFNLLDWGAASGSFAALDLPALGGGLTWNTSQLGSAGVLAVALDGDFNLDGAVDAADYVVWRKGLGTIHTPADYNLWTANFGSGAPGSGTGTASALAVPEPATQFLLLVMAATCILRRPTKSCLC